MTSGRSAYSYQARVPVVTARSALSPASMSVTLISDTVGLLARVAFAAVRRSVDRIEQRTGFAPGFVATPTAAPGRTTNGASACVRAGEAPFLRWAILGSNQ